MKIDVSFRKKARIEMLPLIDIVFLLLVVFIYTMLSMAVHRGLPVVLPTSSTTELDTQRHLSITVQANDSHKKPLIYLDEEQVSLAGLTEALQKKAVHFQSDEGTEPVVFLFADSATSYQQLFQVLDQIRAAGLSKISLQAEETVQSN